MVRENALALALGAATLACSPPPWRDPAVPVDARVADLLRRLTLEEKVAQLSHDAPAIPRLGISSYNWWNEALHGVARAGRATVFPQAIGLAATWDTSLMFRVAGAIGLEARAKYNQSVGQGSRGIYQGLTFWSPNINIVRDPRWGRGMETYGEDPHLAGRLAVAFVRGMQGDDPVYLKTVATPKHFAVHSGPEPDRHRFDAVVSEYDLRQTYLPAFHAAVVDGGAQSVMCAYNRLDGEPACASSRLLGDILRGEWGFTGYVVTDCWAITDIHERHRVAPDETEAAARSLEAGSDLACGPEFRSLKAAVERGRILEHAVDSALARLLRARFRLGSFDPPERVPFTVIGPGAIDSDAHRALAREAAVKSMVLLKNDRDVLPLAPAVRTMAVIGPNADDVDVLLGNYHGTPTAPVTPLAGIRAAATRRGITVRYARGADLAPNVPSLEPIPASALRDFSARYFTGHDPAGPARVERPEPTVAHQWWRDPPLPGLPADTFRVVWSGQLVPPVGGRFGLALRALGRARLLLDDSVLVDFTADHDPLTRWGWADLGTAESRRLTVEFEDRRADASVELLWAPPASGLLDSAVALARQADVAVMILGLSPRLEGEEMPVAVPGFAGGDRVSLGLPESQQALLEAVWATGTPVVLVLLSGSAVAMPWAAERVPAILQAWYPGQAGGDALADVLFGEVSPAGRLPVTIYRSVDDLPPFAEYAMTGRTYRYFRGTPLFPFGHGLSYSRFRYENLTVPPQARAGQSVDLSIDLDNTGSVTADEVVQVYVSTISSPSPEGRGGQGVRTAIRTLTAFTRLSLSAGERTRASFTLDARWFSQPGRYAIWVGGKQPGFHGVADAATTGGLWATIEVTP